MHYPTAKVIAIEPNKTNCAMFRRNCGAYPNIELLEGAIWPRPSMLAISNLTAAAFEFQVNEVTSAEAANLVQAYTISELIEMQGGIRVDLLKLDVEGVKHALFSQGSEAWLGMVDNILVELHDRFMPGCREVFEAMLRNVPRRRAKRGEYEFVELLSRKHD
jgi:FkbM family methyltransferase